MRRAADVRNSFVLFEDITIEGRLFQIRIHLEAAVLLFEPGGIKGIERRRGWLDLRLRERGAMRYSLVVSSSTMP